MIGRPDAAHIKIFLLHGRSFYLTVGGRGCPANAIGAQ